MRIRQRDWFLVATAGWDSSCCMNSCARPLVLNSAKVLVLSHIQWVWHCTSDFDQICLNFRHWGRKVAIAQIPKPGNWILTYLDPYQLNNGELFGCCTQQLLFPIQLTIWKHNLKIHHLNYSWLDRNVHRWLVSWPREELSHEKFVSSIGSWLPRQIGTVRVVWIPVRDQWSSIPRKCWYFPTSNMFDVV